METESESGKVGFRAFCPECRWQGTVWFAEEWASGGAKARADGEADDHRAEARHRRTYTRAFRVASGEDVPL